jgi:hypothetical protein
MKTITEIEVAIEQLPTPQVEELVDWLLMLRQKRAILTPVEKWLQHARGAARPCETTDNILGQTRGET